MYRDWGNIHSIIMIYNRRRSGVHHGPPCTLSCDNQQEPFIYTQLCRGSQETIWPGLVNNGEEILRVGVALQAEKQDFPAACVPVEEGSCIIERDPHDTGRGFVIQHHPAWPSQLYRPNPPLKLGPKPPDNKALRSPSISPYCTLITKLSTYWLKRHKRDTNSVLLSLPAFPRLVSNVQIDQ